MLPCSNKFLKSDVGVDDLRLSITAQRYSTKKKTSLVS